MALKPYKSKEHVGQVDFAQVKTSSKEDEKATFSRKKGKEDAI